MNMLLQVSYVALPIVLPWLISFAFVVAQKELQKLPPARLAYIRSVVKEIVQAAEQSGLTQSLSGPDKKQWAINSIERVLGSMNIQVPSSLIDALIESCVLELNHDFPKLENA